MNNRRAAVNFVLVTALLDIMALGLIIPVQPKLVEEFLGGDTRQGAVVFGLMATGWALMQLIFQPILGALSDRYGRRPVLLFSNLGLGLDYILMAMAPSLAWLVVGRLLSGIAAATFSTANAYIADVTPPERRAAEFGKIGVAFGIGFALGPALGGVLGAADPRLPFWVAAGFSLLNALYGYFILPESLPPEHRRPFRLRAANPITAMTILTRDRVMISVSATLFLYALANTAPPALFVFYASHRYGWTSVETGYALAFAAVCLAIVQSSLIGPVTARLGARLTLIVGLGAGATGFLLQAAATTPPLFLAGFAVFALWGFIGPAAQHMLTARIGPDEQGHLQGAQGSVTSIANLAGPLLFTSVFSWSIGASQPEWMSGAAYTIAATCLLLGALIVAAGTRPDRKRTASAG
ncbi:MAG TPA: TCR/Tet family MFS transporter [Hyphomicrobiaceae bacterium]|nr:TCR/Tet family MFS transporter [Hyphomicrobiaceae bacterium]